MLTLDHTTLFYWTLSDSASNTKKPRYDVEGWAATVPAKVSRPSSQATAIRMNTRNPTPSLTSGPSCLTAPSVLTNDIQITSRPSLASANAIDVRSDGGLSDSDEMRGAEREAAVNSPPKGKKRIVSDVSPYYVLILTSFYTNIVTCSRQERGRQERGRIQKTKRRSSQLDRPTVVSPNIHHNIYIFCRSIGGPLGRSFQAGT